MTALCSPVGAIPVLPGPGEESVNTRLSWRSGARRLASSSTQQLRPGLARISRDVHPVGEKPHAVPASWLRAAGPQQLFQLRDSIRPGIDAEDPLLTAGAEGRQRIGPAVLCGAGRTARVAALRAIADTTPPRGPCTRTASR